MPKIDTPLILGLLNCTKTKNHGRGKARAIYSGSPIFRHQLQYLERECSMIRIVSAKYGLLSPDDEIESYELSAASFSQSEYAAWGERVRSQILALYPTLIVTCLTNLYQICVPPSISRVSPPRSNRGWIKNFKVGELS